MIPGDPVDQNGGENFDENAESARLRVLYRELPSEEPPTALDDTILAAARRATGSRPRAARWWSASRNRRAPLAAAAVLLLAFGVLVQEPWQHSTMPEGIVPDVVEREVTADGPVEAEPVAAESVAVKLMEADALYEEIAKKTAEKNLAEIRSRQTLEREPLEREEKVATMAKQKRSGAMAKQESVDESVDAAAGGTVANSPALTDSATARYAASAEVSAAAPVLPAPAPVAALAPSSMPASEPDLAAEPLPPRSAPWPFGLVPTLAPDTACARLVQDSGGRCHGRAIVGGLELQLSGSDPEWLPQLRSTLHELGWQEENGTATGTARYTRITGTGTERFSWSLQAGNLELRLQAAVP